ncbi:MAG TPA: hypothetical protein VIA45_10345 [Thermoanaerobaculia bacterium]
MRLGVLLLGALLIVAPLSPFVRDVGPSGMKCCPLGQDGSCCKGSGCSMRRCPLPDSLFLAALGPGVLPPSVSAPPPAETGRILPPRISRAAHPVPDLPDPPPRA